MTIFRCDPHPGERPDQKSLHRAFRWAWIPAFAGMTMITACSSEATEKLECLSSPNLNGRDAHMRLPEARRASALSAIELVKKVRAKARSSWFGTGMLSELFGEMSGTEGVSLHIYVKQLRTAVANQVAIDLALAMDGKNPLPASADWACQKLADSVASLSTGQSDDQFLDNLSVVETYLTRVYTDNGGQDLGEGLVNIQTSKEEK